MPKSNFNLSFISASYIKILRVLIKPASRWQDCTNNKQTNKTVHFPKSKHYSSQAPATYPLSFNLGLAARAWKACTCSQTQTTPLTLPPTACFTQNAGVVQKVWQEQMQSYVKIFSSGGL